MSVTLPYVFTIFMLTLGPIKVIPAFAGMVRDATRQQVISLAVRGALQATAIALFIAFGATSLQAAWGVSLDAIRITGGVLLFMAAASGQLMQLPAAATAPLVLDAATIKRLSFMPLSIPVIVTPWGLVAILLFMRLANENRAETISVIAILLLVMALNFVGHGVRARHDHEGPGNRDIPADRMDLRHLAMRSGRGNYPDCASEPRGRRQMRAAAKLLSLAAAVWPAASLLLASVPAAQAADKPETGAALVDPEPWRIGFTAYAWLTNISGSAGARGQSVAVNESFIDLLQRSESLGAFMSYFEADKGRVGLYADFMWTKTSFGQPVTLYRNPLPGLALTLNGSAALKTELTMVEVEWPV